MSSRPHVTRYPAAPLLAIAERRALDRGDDLTPHALADALGVRRESIYRWQTAPGALLTERFADLLACRIGLHPCEIWPSWFADLESVPA